jgi:apolipoprotein N-acyltransferase
MTLAFPPLDAGFLAWFGLAPLFYVLPQARRPRHAFGLGYLFGYAHWGATVIWIGTTVSAWTHSPIGWVAWFLLVAIKSGWFGLFGLLAWWVGKRAEGHARVFGMAAAWTLVEWFRGQSSVAMPWSLVGYTQYRYLPLIQIVDLAGVYAVTLAIGLINAGIAEMARKRKNPTVDPDARPFRLSTHPLTIPLLFFVAIALYGFVALTKSYDGPKVTLALMQPNDRATREAQKLTEAQLWQEAFKTLIRFRAMTAKVVPHKPLLIVWPESEAPFSAISTPPITRAFSELAQQSGAYHFVGTSYQDEQKRSYNSAALFPPDGGQPVRYDKNWLVPMGEWVPMRRWIPFGDVFHFPDDITPGANDQILNVGPIRMCPLICYESVFPIVARTRTAKGANLLVSITNDSWAGESSELQQHIAMAVFRAVETRRDFASSATTGITGLITPTGKLIAIAPYKEDALICEATLREGLTPYVRWGDWLIAVCTIGLVWTWRGKSIRP